LRNIYINIHPVIGRIYGMKTILVDKEKSPGTILLIGNAVQKWSPGTKPGLYIERDIFHFQVYITCYWREVFPGRGFSSGASIFYKMGLGDVLGGLF
jgi:hypothetical protein